MEFREFHNGLRVLLNIDADEFIQAVFGQDTKPAEDTAEWQSWRSFQSHPFMWFIRAPTVKTEALWKYIEKRIGQ